MRYEIERLRNDEEYLEDFLNELPSSWRRQISDVNDFIDYFDQKNTSREIYRVEDATDEEIFKTTKGDTEVEAYAQVEVRCGWLIELYGTEELYDYDEDEKIYTASSFGEYNYIDL